jgi:hypothetical protein
MPEIDSKDNGLITKLAQLSAIYVVYVFLSGWTFFDYYFREFGLDPRWLDLPIQEILVKGFTILFTGGTWLWLIYPILLVGPAVVDETPSLRRQVWIRAALPLLLLAVLVGVYFASRRAGIEEAGIDKGPRTRLTLIMFSKRGQGPPEANAVHSERFAANVLAFRDGVYYLHSESLVDSQPLNTIALSVYRMEDLRDIQVVEH